MIIGQNTNFIVTLPNDEFGHPIQIQEGSARWVSLDTTICSINESPTNPLQGDGQTGSSNGGALIRFKAVLENGETYKSFGLITVGFTELIYE